MIKREDLVAAAAVDLLQYRQIDPLLVFLLQRDVRARRRALAEAIPAQQSKWNRWLSYLAGLLALVTIGLFALVYSSRLAQSVGTGALFLFAGLYGLGTFGVVSWCNRRGICQRMRMLAAVMIASVPLALFALQRVAG